MPTRLVQLRQGTTRRVGRVEEPAIRLLDGVDSVLALAAEAIERRAPLVEIIERRATGDHLDYDPIYAGSSPWRLMVPVDHPEPSRCLVSGTGLTHLGSASSRAAMHGKSDAELTDSMRMFRAGLEGGRPRDGRCGVAPEWFYKGTGRVLRTSGDVITTPAHADDGGEEAEIAGIYVIDPAGQPRRIGMAAGNEFSDHKLEKQNYLHLAGSKLRMCAIGPELVIDPDFEYVPGRVRIERGSQVIWERDVATGDREMCHSLANIEHHHFKFDEHRTPGDLHVHFFGAQSLSYSDEVLLEDGDVMDIQYAGFGRALRNPVRIAPKTDRLTVAQPLA